MPPEKVFSLRLPPDVYDRLAAVAKEEHRSVNAQILIILIQWLTAREYRNANDQSDTGGAGR